MSEFDGIISYLSTYVEGSVHFVPVTASGFTVVDAGAALTTAMAPRITTNNIECIMIALFLLLIGRVALKNKNRVIRIYTRN